MRVIGDLEANGLLDTVTKIWCGVFKDLDTGKVYTFTPDTIKELPTFLDGVSTLIMHNGIGYDLPLLRKILGYTYKGEMVDTLVMSRLLDPKRLVPPNCPNRNIGPHSVEAWGYRVGRSKPEHEDWTQFSPEMLHRCSEDVEIQTSIYKELLREASKGDWSQAFKLNFRLFHYLQKQEEYGWLFDQDYARQNIHTLERWIEKIDSVLAHYLPFVVEVQEQKVKGEYKYVSKPFLKSGKPSASLERWYEDGSTNPESSPHSVAGPFSRISFRRTDLDKPTEVKQFLLDAGWEPLEWNTNDEGERTSPKLSKDDPFDGIESAVGRLVARRVQCRQRKSIIEGLLQIVRPDGRIASVVNNLAVTGRATHRGIVNIPKATSFFGKQMRKMFICRDGYVLVGTDSDQCQLRMLGGRMNNAEYIAALVNGDKSLRTDVHSLTEKVGDLESRDIAKNTMYCLLFGGGDAKLAKTAKKPLGSGGDLRKRLYVGFAGLGELMENLTNEWRSSAKRKFDPRWNRYEYYDGCITGLDGRPIKVPSEHMLLVYLLQSDEAIMMAAAYVYFHFRMEKLGYEYGEDYGVVCWYHDEFTVECKKEIADIVAREAENSIVWAGAYFKIPCPHVGDAKIGTNWYEIH